MNEQDSCWDMCALSYLHEASVMENLRRRFEQQLPYTFAKDVCIALNPYKWFDIYSASIRDIYNTTIPRVSSPDDTTGSTATAPCSAGTCPPPPHVYATSKRAVQCLLLEKSNQSIVVSGESGAGKTETVRIVMDHIANSSSNSNNCSSSNSSNNCKNIVHKVSRITITE